MIDELLYSDETIARTSFTIQQDNVLVFDGVFSEAGLMENIAQTAAAHAGAAALKNNTPVRTGFIGAVKNLAISALPSVNDTITTEIMIEEQVFDASVITGKIMRGEELMAQCEMKIFLQPEV